MPGSQNPRIGHARKLKASHASHWTPSGVPEFSKVPQSRRPQSAPVVRSAPIPEKRYGDFAEFARTPRSGTVRVEQLQEMLEYKADRRKGVRLPAWRACTFRDMPEKPCARSRVFPSDVAKFLHDTGVKVSKQEAKKLLGTKSGGANLGAFHDMISGCPGLYPRMPKDSWLGRLEDVVQSSSFHQLQSGAWPLARNERIGVGIARDSSLPSFLGAGKGSRERKTDKGLLARPG